MAICNVWGHQSPSLATIPGIAVGTYKTGQPYRQT